MLASQYFDFIFSDLNLPDLEPGEIEALAGDIPLVWLSGAVRSEEKRQALIKPVTPHALRQAVIAFPLSESLSTRPDLSYLQNIADGDQEFVNEMVAVFRDEVPEELQKLKAAVHQKDSQTAAFFVHKLRSRIRVFGLNDYKILADRLEPMLKTGEDWVTASRLCRQLIRGLESILLVVSEGGQLTPN
ncbi:MAG: response regulator [Bacteroidia bacterium]